MKKMLLVFMFFIFYQGLYAQQDSTQTKPPPKWEIGTDLLWLISKNPLPDYSVFVRRNFVTKNGKDRAFRFRVGVDIRKENRFLGEKENLLLRAGYEWQKPLYKNKVRLHYGLDFHYFRRYIDQLAVDYFSTPQLRMTIPDYETQVGGVLFYAIQYFPLPKLSFSLEGGLTGYHRTYTDTRNKIEGLIITEDNQKIELGWRFIQNTQEQSWVWLTQPIYVFNVAYHF